jgi:mevalonate kinase
LINTKQSRSTAAEVAKVGTLKKTHPAITNLVLDAIDKVTTSAESLVKSADFDEKDVRSVKALGELFNVNHGLLSALGVSHPKLERVRELVDICGAGWTKLTGAGGGGCAITLLQPPVDAAVLESLDARLDEEGFERFETSLGGDGVGVLWPAVLKNGNGEEAGEDIDQEKFLKARGREGIESLVGVGAGERREGWKFWK